MAADSVKSIPAARRIGMTWMILCLAGAVGSGFIGIAYFHQHPEFTAIVESARPHAYDFVSNLSIVGILSAAAWGLGYFGQPHILVRFMAGLMIFALLLLPKDMYVTMGKSNNAKIIKPAWYVSVQLIAKKPPIQT